MILQAEGKKGVVKVSYNRGMGFSSTDVEAQEYLNKKVRKEIARSSLALYLESRKNLTAEWRLTLTRAPEPDPVNMSVIGVSAVQSRIYGYDGLYWSAPADIIGKYPKDIMERSVVDEYRPSRLVGALPQYKKTGQWELFRGTLEKHLPPDLLTLVVLPKKYLGSL